MPANLNLTSIRTYLTYPFQDREAGNRFAIGAAFSAANFVIPFIPGIFVYGYLVKVMRRTVEEKEPGMPAWDDWGKLFWDGLRAMVIGLIYFLPAIFVSFLGFSLYMAATLILPFTMNGGENANFGLAFPLAFLFMFGGMFVGFILFFLAAVPFPAAMAHFALKDRFAAAFNFKEWWPALRRNGMGYFVAWVIFLGTLGLAYMVYTLFYFSIILCCLCAFATAIAGYYSMLVGAALFAEAYQQGTQTSSIENLPAEASASPAPQETPAETEATLKLSDSETPG
jgi:hypothetical protein